MSRRLTTEEYIEKCKAVHGDTYDYGAVKYVHTKVKVNIICRKHGVFKQWPSDHRRGFGCSECSQKSKGTTEKFISKAKTIHGNFYDYSKSIYTSLDKDIIIICPKHGEFKTKPSYHLYGTQTGCPKCCRSKGEIAIEDWLNNHGIKFEEQKRFETFKMKKFDFYLPEYKMCIEYDGAQHFFEKHQLTSDKSLAKKLFKDVQLRDKEKTLFCLKHGIRLLRIPYFNFKNIKNILTNEILRNSSK
jgi:very-short-patch-repair endonuclease